MMVLTYQITQHQYKHGIEIVVKLIWGWYYLKFLVV
jgi:hypothetical protein